MAASARWRYHYGPDAQRIIGQVQGIDDAPALPTVVAGRVRAYGWVRAGRNVTEPRPVDGDRIDVKRHAN